MTTAFIIVINFLCLCMFAFLYIDVSNGKGKKLFAVILWFTMFIWSSLILYARFFR
jgi:hypothetical protein